MRLRIFDLGEVFVGVGLVEGDLCLAPGVVIKFVDVGMPFVLYFRVVMQG